MNTRSGIYRTGHSEGFTTISVERVSDRIFFAFTAQKAAGDGEPTVPATAWAIRPRPAENPKPTFASEYNSR